MDAERALEQVSGGFDLIFLDPPYAKEQIVADIEKMDEKELFSEDVMVVCETDKAVELPEENCLPGYLEGKKFMELVR